MWTSILIRHVGVVTDRKWTFLLIFNHFRYFKMCLFSTFTPQWQRIGGATSSWRTQFNHIYTPKTQLQGLFWDLWSRSGTEPITFVSLMLKWCWSFIIGAKQWSSLQPLNKEDDSCFHTNLLHLLAVRKTTHETFSPIGEPKIAPHSSQHRWSAEYVNVINTSRKSRIVKLVCSRFHPFYKQRLYSHHQPEPISLRCCLLGSNIFIKI